MIRLFLKLDQTWTLMNVQKYRPIDTELTRVQIEFPLCPIQALSLSHRQMGVKHL